MLGTLCGNPEESLRQNSPTCSGVYIRCEVQTMVERREAISRQCHKLGKAHFAVARPPWLLVDVCAIPRDPVAALTGSANTKDETRFPD